MHVGQKTFEHLGKYFGILWEHTLLFANVLKALLVVRPRMREGATFKVLAARGRNVGKALRDVSAK